MTLFSRFQKELLQKKHVQKTDRVLVAFSGGKDSVCLLFLLHLLCKEIGFDLGACHVHHGIRGTEADEDLAFCRTFCQERGIPFYTEYVDAPQYAKENGIGLEEGARALRYDALERVAQKEKYNKIATAHTASDQAETVLFRLIRGSGINGICGIPSTRENIIRPLLPFYKEEIIEYLEENHLTFKEDSSNSDTIYSRNRLRGRIIPEMEKINPSVEKALVRFAAIAEEQNALISVLCDRWERDYNADCGSGKIPLNALSNLVKHDEMTPVFYEAVSRMAKKEKIAIDFQHFRMLRALLKQPEAGKIIEISNGFAFYIQNDSLIFGKNEAKPIDIQYQVKLHLGATPLPLPCTSISLSDKKQGKVENINKKLLIINAAFDKIEGDLFARNRKEGDALRVGGMTKSLKKLFQEAKIPASNRERVPIICDRKGIVWVPGVGLCDRVRESDTGEIFTMQLCTEPLSDK